ncbi:hypothetical protein COLO4_36101 [Corchorus olitorius]|uniref:Uncharacterized protein n=1 Tax=Corchorus olitorius TaxID=93759 RepID=A0A1R3GB10_9ROSI|nr:hypothetical protein COLO4_36101 [Corchorus olitorius]
MASTKKKEEPAKLSGSWAEYKFKSVVQKKGKVEEKKGKETYIRNTRKP